MSSRHETELEITLVDVLCKIKYSFSPGCRGRRECGQQLEPDDQPEIEIESIEFGGVDVTEYLTDEENESIESRLWDELEEDRN